MRLHCFKRARPVTVTTPLLEEVAQQNRQEQILMMREKLFHQLQMIRGLRTILHLPGRSQRKKCGFTKAKKNCRLHK